MIETKRESFSTCIPELMPLFHRAYEELGQFKDVLRFDPDLTRYVVADEAGAILLMTLRRNGELIGYMITHLMMGLHHAANRLAAMDIMFVDPAYRGRGYIFRLMDATEAELREDGVDVWLCHYVKHNPLGFDRVLDRMGFTPSEMNMAKRLGA